MKYEQVMRQLAARLGIESLALDGEWACTLAFDAIHVHFAPDSNSPNSASSAASTRAAPPSEFGGMVVTTLLGQSKPDDVVLREKLLFANLLGQGTGGATLAMDREGRVYLRRYLRLRALQVESLMSTLESFVNHAEYWQGELQEAAAAHPKAFENESRQHFLRA